MITREKALELVRGHVKNENLVNHMIAVSAIMRAMAERLGGDPDLWELVGILHDIDYEEVGEDWDRHGLVSAEMVSDLLPEEGLHAIRAHNERTGYEAESSMDVSLFAADAASGMLVASALVRPTRLEGMKPSSVRKKMKDSSFARGVSRENMMRCEGLGLDLNEFLAISISAMQSIGGEIGLKP